MYVCTYVCMYIVCMYYVCMYICVCVQIPSLNPLGQLKPGYVYNDYSSRTPGCVTDMVSELGWESLGNRRQNSRLCLLYKTHYGLVDIDKTAYLSQVTAALETTQVFTRNTPSMRHATTHSSPEQSGNGIDCQTL